MGGEPSLLETAPDVALLCGVAETRQPYVKPLRAEQSQEPSYGLGTSNWHDGDSLGVKVPTTARSERFECELVADPFHEHDRARVDAFGQGGGGSNQRSTFHAPHLLSTRPLPANGVLL